MINHQHKKLRNGLTTGTCAAAVAKASAYMLMHQKSIQQVSVLLPVGQEVILEITNPGFTDKKAFCNTIKDAGDDPDITHGAEICATAQFIEGNEIIISGGLGIGTVTKPGLAVQPGNPAINPVPMQMILNSVREVVPEGTGITIEISIPKGEELAKRTFNPQLGIIGGLSILGTTGIVKPMSEEALKDSLVVKLEQLKAMNKDSAVFSPGNYSTSFSKENLPVNDDDIVLTSNFIGFMLEQALSRNFKSVVLIGHLGKLVKIAGGVFQTHSRVADARNEILAAHYFSYSEDAVGFHQIMKANTTEEAIDFVQNQDFWTFFANKIKERAERFVYNEMKIEVVLLSQKAGLLATTKEAINLLNNMQHD